MLYLLEAIVLEQVEDGWLDPGFFRLALTPVPSHHLQLRTCTITEYVEGKSKLLL